MGQFTDSRPKTMTTQAAIFAHVHASKIPSSPLAEYCLFCLSFFEYFNNQRSVTSYNTTIRSLIICPSSPSNCFTPPPPPGGYAFFSTVTFFVVILPFLMITIYYITLAIFHSVFVYYLFQLTKQLPACISTYTSYIFASRSFHLFFIFSQCDWLVM